MGKERFKAEQGCLHMFAQWGSQTRRQERTARQGRDNHQTKVSHAWLRAKGYFIICHGTEMKKTSIHRSPGSRNTWAKVPAYCPSHSSYYCIVFDNFDSYEKSPGKAKLRVQGIRSHTHIILRGYNRKTMTKWEDIRSMKCEIGSVKPVALGTKIITWRRGALLNSTHTNTTSKLWVNCLPKSLPRVYPKFTYTKRVVQTTVLWLCTAFR